LGTSNDNRKEASKQKKTDDGNIVNVYCSLLPTLKIDREKCGVFDSVIIIVGNVSFCVDGAGMIWLIASVIKL